MIIKNETKYVCEVCGDSLRTKEICEKHEIECRKQRDEKEKYKNRIKELSKNRYIFHAKSVEDIENCIRYNLGGFIDDYDYENSNYPCFVLLTTYSEQEPYEDYYSDYVNVKLLDDYINRIEEIKREVLENEQV